MNVKTPKDTDTKMVAHARRELEIAGAFDKTEDYDGQIGRSVLALVKLFDKWCHGNRAMAESVALGFNQIVSGELLSPPTTDPDEWEVVEGADLGTVRNKRSPFYVSSDNGKTWMHLGDKETGYSKNHITGEIPQDENISEATKESATGDQGSSENTAEQDGSELNTGVAEKSTEDPSESKSATEEPQAGQEK